MSAVESTGDHGSRSVGIKGVSGLNIKGAACQGRAVAAEMHDPKVKGTKEGPWEDNVWPGREETRSLPWTDIFSCC